MIYLIWLLNEDGLSRWTKHVIQQNNGFTSRFPFIQDQQGGFFPFSSADCLSWIPNQWPLFVDISHDKTLGTFNIYKRPASNQSAKQENTSF